ncbi:MAG TPA: site-specific integrase [Acidimicrobiia bacterium]|nr:site-specific integrase [Acidimicrobiia bacterium]
MAHIRRTDAGGWQVRYRDPGGRERARNFRRKTDAERFSVTVAADKIRGMWADPRLARITVSEWLSTWQASRVHLRPSTRALSESLLRNHVLPYFGDRRLGSVTPTDVQGFVAHLEEKGLAASTVRQCYLLVAGLFSSALDSDIIVRSPCRRINLPRDSKTEMRFLAAEEVTDLAEVIDDRYRALVLTAAYAGCRFGELAGLKVHRLDLLRRSLTVAEALSEVRGQVRLAAPKTAAARRQVALPKFLADELSTHMAVWPLGADGFVFTAPQGGPLLRRNFRRRAWLPAVQASVGEPMRFHDLRHTHAAMLIAQGEHPKVIQNRLGHSSIKVTLDTYGHLFDGLDEAAAERLNAIFPATIRREVADIGVSLPHR